MPTITVRQLQAFIKEHDEKMGTAYGASTLFYYLGAPTLGYQIKDVYTGLKNKDPDRELTDIELFRLGRLLQEAMVEKQPLPTLQALCDSFGVKQLKAITYLIKNAVYRFEAYQAIQAAEKPLGAAKLFYAQQIIKTTGLTSSQKQQCKSLIDSHAAPVQLALGLRILSLSPTLFNDKNVTTVGNAQDPHAVAKLLHKAYVFPTMNDEDVLNPGYFHVAKKFWHMDYQNIYADIKQENMKKSHQP